MNNITEARNILSISSTTSGRRDGGVGGRKEKNGIVDIRDTSDTRDAKDDIDTTDARDTRDTFPLFTLLSGAEEF